jgi:hypothetical protein
MPLTPHQRAICRLLADNRIAAGDSYLAGGTALNEALGGSRVSRDVDIFHDTAEAVEAAWRADDATLRASGYDVRAIHERPGLVEAEVSASGGSVVIQWARDSAFRFFPLVRHDELGLVLHPFDLATNKVLALVGRLEPRDWIDTITCDERLQPLGYLAWAACGKDPGFSPLGVIARAARANRHSQSELNALSFEGEAPDAADLSRRWHAILDTAREQIGLLPAAEAGKAILTHEGAPFRGGLTDLASAIRTGALAFHAGAIRGALPRIAG